MQSSVSRACKLRVELQTIIVALFLVQVLPAAAQLPSAVQPQDSVCATAMDRDAFFHVSVTGKPRGDNPKDRYGKAFAIGPNLLVTAQHVLGDPDEWEMKSEKNKEIARAARLLDRQIELRRVRTSDTNNLSDPIRKSFVLPASSYAINAAGLSVPGLNVEKPFCLSMCKIVKSGTYRAIMTSDEKPGEAESLKNLTDVKLHLADPDPERYGSLYVFNVDMDSSKFHGEKEGHDGSPILDGEGRVVALVSAVTKLDGGGLRILATSIGPLFPGTSELLSRALDSAESANASLRCSLVDTVKRIHDQVATYATSWSLHVPRGDDGRPGTVQLSYESVSDTPNVKSIEVYYEYWGKYRPVDAQAATITGYSDRNEGYISIGADTNKERTFSSDEISSIGKTSVEPFVKAKHKDGQIETVRLLIVPEFTNGKRASKPIIREFPWRLMK
jgi:hypothetical protein